MVRIGFTSAFQANSRHGDGRASVAQIASDSQFDKANLCNDASCRGNDETAILGENR
jgi:hypothetical protein